MIPLRDSVRPRKYPFINMTIILANVAIFVYQQSLGQEELVNLYYRYGVIPQRFLFLSENYMLPKLWLPLLSSLFLHGGWFHLLGNMLYLWVFGDNVEDRFGHGGYLLFYLFAGAAGSISHITAHPQSPIPTVGASGAIAGVLGAYFIFFPRARVLALVPIGFFITTVQLPAMFFLFLWFLLQLLNASLAWTAGGAQAVAWWAHIGGFASGFAIAVIVTAWRKITRPG